MGHQTLFYTFSGKKVMKAKNPPGVITKDLFDKTLAALSEEVDGGIRIEVEGEEDLASLIAITHAPKGAIIIYGMPNLGLTVIKVDDDAKKIATDMLKRMEA